MKNIHKISILVFSAAILISAGLKQEDSSNKKALKTALTDSVKIDKSTGLIVDKGLDLVTAHCTGCHSSKLITQFHTDRAGWLEKIRWMQQKQKLWPLGDAETAILDYLAKNYPAFETVNRRAALKGVEWYKLK
jgi:mono/diheme cytochrome c family protein